MKSVILIVIDGWGMAPPSAGNAITQANLPTFNHLWSTYPHTTLAASGEAVGLPRGEDGNTETGHLNLGAGRIVYQDLPRINMAIADGSFFKNNAFLACIDHTKNHSGKLHIVGLIGSGGVHSNIEHLFALLNLCKEHQYKEVYLHLISDGRDSPPTSAATYIEQVNQEINSLKIGTIASVIGRYFAMDRDLRWDRTEKAYRALTLGEGRKTTDIKKSIEESYKRGETDEFIEPTLITKPDGNPIALIQAGDGVILFNFRVDRVRQLTKAFVLDDFTKEALRAPGFDPYSVEFFKKHMVFHLVTKEPFNRGPKIDNLFFVTMTEYEKGLPVDSIAFPPQKITLPLGRIISDHEFHQLRITESEKERFVTYYFNGQREEPLPFEDHIIIPSPKVPTYDLKPEMSAAEMTESIIEQLQRIFYQFILVNFPNADMVGHTGVKNAAILACETLDQALGKIIPVVLSLDGYCIITADHGNVEEMLDPKTGNVDTEHTTNPVPCIIIGREFEGKGKELTSGILADVAPTVLGLMNITKPSNMTGRNLLQ